MLLKKWQSEHFPAIHVVYWFSSRLANIFTTKSHMNTYIHTHTHIYITKPLSPVFIRLQIFCHQNLYRCIVFSSLFARQIGSRHSVCRRSSNIPKPVLVMRMKIKNENTTIKMLCVNWLWICPVQLIHCKQIATAIAKLKRTQSTKIRT